MAKIQRKSLKTFQRFCRNYYTNQYPNQRFGQAFLNTYFPEVVDTELFYTENINVAIRTIFEKYLTQGEKK